MKTGPSLQLLKRRLLLVSVLLLAFALRLVAIDKLPPGLSHDEAYNGITALQLLDGEWRIFFEINKGIEPLIIYLEALAFYGLGVGPVQMRLVNIFFGMLTVVLVYPFATRLFNRQIALLAMAGLAISFWAIFTSRLSLRATLFPPLLLLTLYFFWRGLSPGPQSHPSPLFFWGLSGVAAGITMYTYLSSRFVPLLVLALFGYQWLCGRITRQQWLGLLLHFLIWACLFAPLAAYYLENAESFTRRSDQVSTLPYALDGDFGPMIKNTGRTLGMFTFQGDTTDRYNLNGRPIFDWGNGLLFYLGLGMIVWQALRAPLKAGPSVMLLGTLFFMLLPGFITDDGPHFLRTIGAMPVVYILWAVGLVTAGCWLSGGMERLGALSPARSKALLYAPLVACIIILSLITLHTGFDYFWRWANAPEARHIYGADIAEVAHYLKTAPGDDLAVISAEYYRDLDPFRFALHFQGQPPFVIWFDGTQSLAFPPRGSSLSPRYIFPDSAPPADTWIDFLQWVPDESGKAYRLYHLPAEPDLQAFQAKLEPLQVTVNDDLTLLGYQLLGEIVSGGKANLLLAWQALRALPPGADYTFIIQLRDSRQHLWLEVDGNGYDADDWQPGVQAMQLLTLRFPGDLPPQTYQLSVSVVNRQTRQALPASTGETAISLKPVQARLAPKPREIELDRLPNPIQFDAAQPGQAPELALRGYQLSDHTVRVGDKVDVTLYWQVLEQPHSDYRLQFSLRTPQNRQVYVWPLLNPINGEWPTQQWPAHYWVQDKLSLPVGADIPAGSFKLQVAWVPPHSQSSTSLEGFELGDIVVALNN
jgi:4-amino-4-deoxy-L-arabinose transferase-like glycosyltransferase